MKIEIRKSRWTLLQKWHFRCVAENGKILCSSEKYFNRVDCYAAVQLLKKFAAKARVFDESGQEVL